jgi:outer membrane protein OmpA-like peptidoglycan-associated protein
MTRIGHAVCASVLLIASMASAQQPQVPSRTEVLRACAGDVERLCPGVPPGQGRIKACMKEHVSQLSTPCFDKLLGAVTVMYTVNSDLAFPPGGWQLLAAGKEVFSNLVKKLAPTQENKLYVSGFTDSTPIGPELMAQGITSNQQLSQMRADNVMRFLISQGVNPGLIAAQGFGDGDPVASNDTPEGQAKNRRVELSLYPLRD